MAKQRFTLIPANDTAISRKRSPIDLRIHCADILLSGRFHRWQATAFTGLDLDQASIRMAVDSTSPDQLTGEMPADNLFSFCSSRVERVNPALFRADGDLVTRTGTHPFQLQIELPEGHNAFFAVSFVTKKDVLGDDAWGELVTGGSGAGGIDAERRLDPWAGVRDAELAAA